MPTPFSAVSMLPVSPPPSAAPRRLRAPPALTRGGETIPASPVLDELPGELGVVLWRSVRSVALWTSTPPERRAGLFAPEAAPAREGELSALEVDAELLAPLSVMVRLLEVPEAMQGARLVNACRRIAVWAEQRGALGTALEFAQAAALAAPGTAALAYAVGRLARRRAEYDRAESWYARAIVQARRTSDWRTYALGYSGLGNLNLQKGNYPVAERAQRRGLKAALRHNLHDLQGVAYHDLFATEVEMREGAASTNLASSAFAAYGPHHPYLPRLAFDVAYHWILQGCFDDALRVARALAPVFDTPAEQALVFSLIARSAGGARAPGVFESARSSLERLVASGCADDSRARALLGVCYGAASLGGWALAERAARDAIAAATLRKEGRIALAAEAALDLVLARPGPPAVLRPPAPHETLAEEFEAALEMRSMGVAIPV